MSAIALLLALTARSEYARPEPLVETDWLEVHLDDPALRIVDTRSTGYDQGHIPGAVWLDIDASRDKNHPPTYLPDLGGFVGKLEALGISSGTRVVFYDDRGGVNGTRPWVLLRMLGHENAALLNGGYSKWKKEGRRTTNDAPAYPRGKLTVKEDRSWIATAEDVAASIGKEGIRIVDTRTEEEIAGSDLRGNPRGGAVPTSTPIYWEDTLDASTKTIKPASELRALFQAHGLEPEAKIITYCQAGGRAAHELFVLYLMGYDDLRLYLGSWEDWSRNQELPLASPRK